MMTNLLSSRQEETNQTDDIPVMKISNDNGKTFEPLWKLGYAIWIGQITFVFYVCDFLLKVISSNP